MKQQTKDKLLLLAQKLEEQGAAEHAGELREIVSSEENESTETTEGGEPEGGEGDGEDGGGNGGNNPPHKPPFTP